MSITIRRAEKSDADLIAYVVAAAIGEEAVQNYCGEQYLAVLKEIVETPQTQYSYQFALVAELDGVKVGGIVGYDGGLLYPLREKTLEIIHRYNPGLRVHSDETESGEFYLDSIGVLPEYRGCGVGGALIQAMCECAFNAGHSLVGLIVDVHNPRAEKLYQSQGFVRCGKREFFAHEMWHLQKRKGKS